jgi:hypothetical protein
LLLLDESIYLHILHTYRPFCCLVVTKKLGTLTGTEPNR